MLWIFHDTLQVLFSLFIEFLVHNPFFLLPSCYAFIIVVMFMNRIIIFFKHTREIFQENSNSNFRIWLGKNVYEYLENQIDVYFRWKNFFSSIKYKFFMMMMNTIQLCVRMKNPKHQAHTKHQKFKGLSLSKRRQVDAEREKKELQQVLSRDENDNFYGWNEMEIRKIRPFEGKKEKSSQITIIVIGHRSWKYEWDRLQLTLSSFSISDSDNYRVRECVI